MATTPRHLGPGPSRVTFANGTTVESSVGRATINQVVPRRRRTMTARALGAEDVLPNLDAALREVGMREQETIEIELDERNRALRSADADRVTLKPKPVPNAVQVVLYRDESGGLSW